MILHFHISFEALMEMTSLTFSHISTTNSNDTLQGGQISLYLHIIFLQLSIINNSLKTKYHTELLQNGATNEIQATTQSRNIKNQGKRLSNHYDSVSKSKKIMFVLCGLSLLHGVAVYDLLFEG